MKKILFACLTASVLFLFSCSNEKSEEKKIVGTWEAYYIDFIDDDETDSEDLEPGEWTITFNADGTFVDVDGRPFEGKYSISDHKLILSYEGDYEDTTIFTIDKLTKKDLVVYEEGYDDGAYWRETIYFKKK